MIAKRREVAVLFIYEKTKEALVLSARDIDARLREKILEQR